MYLGEILLATIKYYNFTDEGNWRYLTAGEKATALAEGLQIKNVDPVRVYNKGYSIFSLNNYVMSPNGHICMYVRAIGATYTYWPPVPGKAFYRR